MPQAMTRKNFWIRNAQGRSEGLVAEVPSQRRPYMRVGGNEQIELRATRVAVMTAGCRTGSGKWRINIARLLPFTCAVEA
jgi:hypothetical protein